MRVSRALAFVLALAAPGCLGTVIDGDVTRDALDAGDVRVGGGALRVLEGARYELREGALRLGGADGVVVNGEIEVRGDMVLRDVTIHGLYRLVAFPGATILWENVTLAPGAIAPTMHLAGRARLAGCDLRVFTVIVRADAEIERCALRGEGVAPVLLWRAGAGTVRDSIVESAGHGIVVEGGDLVVSGNDIRAGAAPEAVALGACGGALEARGNRIEGGGIGIGIDGARAVVAQNVIRGTGTAGIAVVGARGGVVEQNVIERGARAGIYLERADAATRATGNVVRDMRGADASDLLRAGAGIVVEGGAPRVEDNELGSNDIGVAVLAGTPVVRGNRFEDHRGFALLRDVAPGPLLDARDNWWGSAAGPIPAAPGALDTPPAPTGQERVGPGVLFAPWRTQRGPAA